MVLTPRRRRQVGGGNTADDGDKKARSPGRARNKPLKPLRAGMPGVPAVTVVTMLVCLFSLLHARLRVRLAPGIPHALFFQGGRFMHNSGASRREIVDSYSFRCLKTLTSVIARDPSTPEASPGFGAGPPKL